MFVPRTRHYAYAWRRSDRFGSVIAKLGNEKYLMPNLLSTYVICGLDF